MQQEAIIVKTIGIYPTEQYIITNVAKQKFEGNESQAIRFMIREYVRLTGDGVEKDGGNAQPLPLLREATR
jgi:hypothetical protein